MRIVRGDFEQTRNHWWWRPGWSEGTRYYTFHLTFESDPSIADEAARYAAALSSVPGLDVVPGQWLHLTMTGVGPAEALEPATAIRVAAEVFAAAEALPFEPIVFDTLFIYSEGAALSVDDPAGWLQDLKALQEREVRNVRSEAAEAFGAFHPHVSLTYFNDGVDEAALLAALEEAEPRDIRVARPTLSLIELGRDDRVYTWRVVEALPLGA